MTGALWRSWGVALGLRSPATVNHQCLVQPDVLRYGSRVLRPALVTALALVGLTAVGPGAAQASTELTDQGFYEPQNGAELLQVIDKVTDTPERGEQGAIKLAAKTYAIDRPIVIRDHTGETITGAGAGQTIITGTGAAKTLLQLEGENQRVYALSIRGTATTTAAYPLVEMLGRAELDTTVEVDVPGTMPNVTGILATGPLQYSWDNRVAADVYSEANAPAIRATGPAHISGPVEGGNPTIDIDQSQGDSDVRISGDLYAGPQTHTVIRATGGADATTLIVSAAIDGTASAATLLSLRGTNAAAGTLDAHLWNSTLLGSSGSTAIELAPGLESRATKLSAIGLLSLGSTKTIACAAPASRTPTTATIDGTYREGTNQTTTACAISEQHRRTGDPRFRDRAAGDLTPLWGSSLIDATPAIQFRGETIGSTVRPSVRSEYGSSTSLPNDIGAIEYQYTPPEFGAGGWSPLDAHGLIRYTVEAFDPDPEEDGQIVLTWHLPDGTTSHEPSVTWRWADPSDPQEILVDATDVSGITRSTYVRSYESFFTPPPATPGPTTPTTPTPLPSAQTPVPPRKPTRPPIVMRANPAPILSRLDVGRRTTRAASRRLTGEGTARRTEASIKLTTISAATVTLVATRKDGRKMVRAAQVRIAGCVAETRVRLTSRFGRARLGPGVYRVVITVDPEGTGDTLEREITLRVH